MQSASSTVTRPDLSGLDDVALLELVTAGIERLDDAAAVHVAATTIARLRTTALAGGVDDEMLRDSVRGLARCESAVTAEKLRRIAEVDARQAFRGEAQRSTADWLADATGATISDARRQVRTAQALTRLPETSRRLAAGDIAPAHADAAAQGLAELDHAGHDARRNIDDVAAWEAAMAAHDATVSTFDHMVADTAPTVDRTGLGQRIDVWLRGHAPDVVDARERRAVRRRGLSWSAQRDADGLWRGITRATDADRAQLDAAITPLARHRCADDTRTQAQRNLDALVTIARRQCDLGTLPRVGGNAAHVIQLVDSHGNTTIPGIGPVSSATAALLACDATTTMFTRTPQGTWDVGHVNGNPRKTQRDFVLARDLACVGCGAPAWSCHIHHIRWRRHGGPTTVDNLVLVCWACHQAIHTLGWTITGDPTTGYSIDKQPQRPPTTTAPPRGGAPPTRPAT